MMMGHGLVQPGWDNPSRGRHTAHPDDHLDGRRGPRAPTAGSPVDQGKGMGAASTLGNVAWLEAAVAVAMQGQQPCDGGTGHHDDRGGDGVGR
jgi:hypothetical protein